MRYALGALAIVVIAFIAIYAVVNNNPGTNKAPKQNTTVVHLSSLANTNAEVSVTIRGRITGNDTFRSIRIRINGNERVVEILDGYERTVERSKVYSNNQTAFTELLYALDNTGFTRKQTPKYSDPKGVCPTGNLYFYDYTTNDGQDHQLWSSTCAQTDGNFAGSGGLVRQVMQAQITDYSKFVSNVVL